MEELEHEENKEWKLKLRLTDMAEAGAPELDEKDLMAFYKALVISGAEEAEEHQVPLLEAPKTERLPRQKRLQLLDGLEKRLADSGVITAAAVSEASTAIANVPVADRRPLRLAAILSQMSFSSSAPTAFSTKGKEKYVPPPSQIPTGIVSRQEWQALFESLVSDTSAHPEEGRADASLPLRMLVQLRTSSAS